MWRAAGVRRAGPQLAEASETIHRWCRYVLARQFANPAGWELQNMLTVASLIVESALARTESRGVHLRERLSRARRRPLAPASVGRAERLADVDMPRIEL